MLALCLAQVPLLSFEAESVEAQSEKQPLWIYETRTRISSVSMSADGSYIAVKSFIWDGSGGGIVYLFSKDENTPLWQHDIGQGSDVSISSDGSYIAALGYYQPAWSNMVYLYSKTSGVPLWSDKPPVANPRVDSLSISADGSYIVAIANALWSEGYIFLYSRESDTPIWTYGPAGYFRSTVSMSSDARFIVAGGRGKWPLPYSYGLVYLFSHDLPSHRCELKWIYDVGDPIESVSVSSDGSRLAVGSVNEKIYFFSTLENIPIWIYDTDGCVHSVAVSSDGTYIAAGSVHGASNGMVYLFSDESSNPLWSYFTESEVCSVSISSDGQYIIAHTRNGIVYFFSRSSSTPLWSFRTKGHPYDPHSVSISSDGTYAVVGDQYGKVYLFETGPVNRLPSAPSSPLCEGQTNPTNVTDLTPDFSAVYEDPDTGDKAVYYQIQVNTLPDFSGTMMWDSGKTPMAPLAIGVLR